MSGQGVPITAQHVAVAIVAACEITGLKPERIFDDVRGAARTRMMAAGALVSRSGATAVTVARMLSLHPARLAPSALVASRIFATDLAVIERALESAGLAAGARLRGRGPALRQDRGATTEEARPRQAPVASLDRPDRKEPVARAATVEKLRAVTPSIARWARQQHELGADMDFVAWCFGVCPDALSDAIGGRAAA